MLAAEGLICDGIRGDAAGSTLIARWVGCGSSSFRLARERQKIRPYEIAMIAAAINIAGTNHAMNAIEVNSKKQYVPDGIR
ncbi:Hypothetical protein POVN_LOCUS656 [uncultured virus]|nr:Hypothetical protein POVN_LOCUS656 [uncultured virus]